MDTQISTKDKILNAALNEFGSKGYALASTNTMAKTALLSKGVFFKYFHSKAELFLACYKRELDRFLEAYNGFQVHLSDELFEQIIDILIWKGQYAQDHPEASEVLLEGLANPPPEIKEQILESMIKLKDVSMATLFSKIQLHNLRDDLTPTDVQRVLNIAISGLQATYINKQVSFKVLESIRQESIDYIKIIIRGMEK